MSWGVGLALLTLISALLATSYVNQTFGLQERPVQALVWQSAPVTSPWPETRRWTYQDAQEHTAATLQVVEREQEWCETDEQVGLLSEQLAATNDVDLVWRNLRTAVTGDDLDAVLTIADATATARGTELEALPGFWLVTRTQLRRWGCLSETVFAMREAEEEEEESTLGDPADRLNQLLGLRDPALSDAIRRQLRITLWGGWYTEPDDLGQAATADGPGNVYLVSRTPLPIEKIETISHELLHVLQDQELGWKLHDQFLEPETSDVLTARRWLIEGDASANELTRYSSGLRELVASHHWGPVTGLEIELARRAYEALSPVESAATLAPYRDGAESVARIVRVEGQSAVNALLHDPPPSTEQLMHTEKLSADELPLQLRDLDALRDELLPQTLWQEPVLDRMGEHWLRTLIASATRDPERSRAAAAGWGSDQIALWRSLAEPEDSLVTMQFVFDDADEHDEGAAGLLTWLVAHSDGEARQAEGWPIVGWDGPSGFVRLITREPSIWLIADHDEDRANRLAIGLAALDLTDYWDE